jgi:hypothetical protein
MFVSSRLVYLQLQKTGCTHIAKLLDDIVGGEQVGKHNRLPDGMNLEGRRVLGSIRNPWDWYVSLWAFGCKGTGDLYNRLAVRRFGTRRFRKRPLRALALTVKAVTTSTREWREVYQSPEDPDLFRRWLRMVHDPKYRDSLGEGYGRSRLSQIAGFLTYRYAFLYTRELEPLYTSAFDSQEAVAAYLDAGNVLDFAIRQERLEDDLVAALRSSGIELTDDHLAHVYESRRSNTSTRVRDLSYYYDPESIDLVAQRDKALIDRYGYQAPSPHAPA